MAEVLVVDDDPDIRMLVAFALEDSGYTVRQASDGEAALVALEAKAPDVMVCDVMMPGTDGFDVLAALRKTEYGRAMAIVMLTAKTRPTDILRGTRLGADLYVTKPFDPNHVAEQLAFHALRRSPGARTESNTPVRPGRRRQIRARG